MKLNIIDSESILTVEIAGSSELGACLVGSIYEQQQDALIPNCLVNGNRNIIRVANINENKVNLRKSKQNISVIRIERKYIFQKKCWVGRYLVRQNQFNTELILVM